jgi:hypothetical protein
MNLLHGKCVYKRSAIVLYIFYINGNSKGMKNLKSYLKNTGRYGNTLRQCSSSKKLRNLALSPSYAFKSFDRQYRVHDIFDLRFFSSSIHGGAEIFYFYSPIFVPMTPHARKFFVR